MTGTLNNSTPARDAGTQQVHYLIKKVTYSDNGSAKTVGVIPANSLIIKPASGIQVTTAFNAGTTNVIDVGYSSEDDLFATDLALGTATFVALDEAIGGFFVSSETTVTATVGLSGTAATAGEGYVVIAYVILR